MQRERAEKKEAREDHMRKPVHKNTGEEVRERDSLK